MNLLSLLRHISLKHVRLQKAQLLIAVSGICLGVAAMVSIDIVNQSVLHSFEDSINHVTGRAALQITAGESGLPEKLLDLVENVVGIEYAVPVIETNANFSGGSERSLMILGIDVLQDHKIRDCSITDETADVPDPLLFLAKSDSILLTRAMAEREGIRMDQEIQLQTVQGIKTFKVRGLLDPEGPARVAGGDIAVMDIYAVQMVFGKADRIDRIDVSFLPGATLDTMKERVRRVLPEGYTVDTPAARTRQVEMLLNRFRKSIGLISLMAVFVGMYLIYNAVSISVVQRRKEIGILRALGVQRGEITRLFLGETFAISILGALLGVGRGLVFAKLTIGVVAQSVTDMYLKASVNDLAFSWKDIARDAGVGIIASLAAAALPAVSSARITPISAIRATPYAEDGFNPWDYTQFIVRPIEERKIGVPSISATMSSTDWTCQLVWVPWLVPYRLPKPNERWSVIPVGTALSMIPDAEVIAQEPDLPAWKLTNGSAGLRIQRMGEIEWAVNLFHGYDPRPVFKTTALRVTESREDLVIDPRFVPSFHRITSLGMDGAAVKGDWSLRGEAAYTFNRAFDIRQELWGYPNALVPGITPLKPVEIESDTLDYGIAADYRLVEDCTLTLQAQQTLIVDRPANLFERAIETLLWANLRVQWMNQKIETNLNLAYNPEHGASMVRPSIYYVFADSWKAGIIGLLLDGPPQSIFGRYAKNDQIEMVVLYSW